MTDRRNASFDPTAVRSALLAERARLQGEAAALDADEMALATAQRMEGGIAGDSADVASDLVEAEVDEALEQTVRQRLADVDAALHRMQTDTYGRCEECGAPIDPARLRALPWARRCLSCQRRAERPRAPRVALEEEVRGSLIDVDVPIPERCPSCQKAEFVTEPEVDAEGAPTGMLLVLCASCGRDVAALPQPGGPRSPIGERQGQA